MLKSLVQFARLGVKMHEQHELIPARQYTGFILFNCGDGQIKI